MGRWSVALLKGMAPYGVAAVLLVGLQRSRIAESLDLLLYDLFTSQRPAPAGKELPITLIGLDESDIQTYGWPIEDGLLCRAIEQLGQEGAVAIGLDLYRDKGMGPNQDCLRQLVKSEPRLVTIFNVAEGIEPIPGAPPERLSFNDLVVDADGVMRRDLVHVAGQDEATVSLPLRLVEVASGSKTLRSNLDQGSAAGPWLETESGGYHGLDAAGYQQMLPFRRPGSFPTWNLQALLAGKVPATQIQGHIVLIGSTAPSLRDLFEIPHTRFTSGAKQLLMPGVEIHALRVAALLDRQNGDLRLHVWTSSGQLDLALELLAVVLGIALGEAFRSLRRSVVAVALVGLGLAGGLVALLSIQHIWIGAITPLAGLSLMAGAGWLRRGAASQQQRQQIQRLLGQTTSPAVAKQLWEQREELLSDGRFEGRQLPVTILFSDTRNFTSVSEQLQPAELLSWLNRGMAYCVPAITERGGMVNKFTGDGFLAVFGAPVSESPTADARAAIETALDIQNGLDTLNQELAREGAPAMHLRIGIHSGEVLAGSMGSSERLEYAVIGDTVNCASRLESIDKTRQDNICRVLVSSATRALLPEDWALEWEHWGELQVKGRQEPLDIWELRGAALRDSAPAAAPATPQ
ncbi:adenylate/guanylate cyclase domain-containing protein [Synechococcus sp. CS-1328]|uniref:adenylate/guanylate cyclase domain-containing protein n=1 Tax=Synechococcus sp. CS-1328 TaxID=2847976 RepID=UPI00223C50DF|nr:adenylate/guanylate cyclase domain-containing protein [Synechococcus sp. CS-1328]MCT0223677.1 adenylate/guanylate cyclase domain-containing protein [Synechococcus sp. CS-1328]